jgi:hypothetical protein
MRLLSFLSDLESALRKEGNLFSPQPCTRFVDYTRSIARMRMEGDRVVVLRIYRLASGRMCLRVFLEADEVARPVETLYPEAQGFSWAMAVYEVQKSLAEVMAAVDMERLKATSGSSSTSDDEMEETPEELAARVVNG